MENTHFLFRMSLLETITLSEQYKFALLYIDIYCTHLASYHNPKKWLTAVAIAQFIVHSYN